METTLLNPGCPQECYTCNPCWNCTNPIGLDIQWADWDVLGWSGTPDSCPCDAVPNELRESNSLFWFPQDNQCKAQWDFLHLCCIDLNYAVETLMVAIRWIVELRINANSIDVEILTGVHHANFSDGFQGSVSSLECCEKDWVLFEEGEFPNFCTEFDQQRIDDCAFNSVGFAIVRHFRGRLEFEQCPTTKTEIPEGGAFTLPGAGCSPNTQNQWWWCSKKPTKVEIVF